MVLLSTLAAAGGGVPRRVGGPGGMVFLYEAEGS
jgi:hypothetical protein